MYPIRIGDAFNCRASPFDFADSSPPVLERGMAILDAARVRLLLDIDLYCSAKSKMSEKSGPKILNRINNQKRPTVPNRDSLFIFGVPIFWFFSLLVLCLFKLHVEAKKRKN